jgi:hypothetical protein
MAVPAPRTWVAGETETATIFNGDHRDSLTFLLAPPRVSVYRSAATSPANATWTLVAWDAEEYDPYSTPMHSLVSNISRLTAPEDGIYVIYVNIEWAANATGDRGFDLRKNSADSNSGGTRIRFAAQDAPGTLSGSTPSTIEEPFNAGDYAQVFVWQNSGGGLALGTGNDSSQFQMRWQSKL